MSNNNNIPGMTFPTIQAMVGANARDSAIAQQNASNAKLQQLLQTSKGGRRKKHRFGGAITVPQFTMAYTVQNGVGQDPNSQITQNAAIGTQGASNAVYDSLALQKGGNITWGCYSGGNQSQKFNKIKKTRKTKKTKKTKKIRKIKKNKKN
jgi:hypothetical protein